MSAAYIRPDFDVVTHWVPQGASVLDLGCGDGELLARLLRERNAKGYGVEIADAGVLASMQRGLNIVQADIEGGLNLFGDAAFDVVILSQTLQATRHTEALVNEVLRVGKSAIVTLPKSLVGALAARHRWSHAGVKAAAVSVVRHAERALLHHSRFRRLLRRKGHCGGAPRGAGRRARNLAAAECSWRNGGVPDPALRLNLTRRECPVGAG